MSLAHPRIYPLSKATRTPASTATSTSAMRSSPRRPRRL